MRNLKRLTALVLSIILAISAISLEAYAYDYGWGAGGATSSTVLEAHDPDRYTDIKGHWAENALRNAVAYGLLVGRTETTIAPDAPITRAEMATLMSRTFEATKSASLNNFMDVTEDDWYYNYLSRAVQMGLLNGNGNAMNPNGHITRQDAAVVFARAFNLYSYKTSATGYSDANSISSYASEAVQACIGAGIMGGNTSNLNPQGYLSRAEFASMMYGLVQCYVNSAVPFSGSGTLNGSLMITTPDVMLSGVSITGNVYLGDGVENGTITLDGVNVGNTLYIRGGSRLILTGGTTIGTVVVYNPSYAVAVETDQTSRIGRTIIDTSVAAITLTGNVGDVTMNTSKAILNLQSATVGSLNANVMLPSIVSDKDTVIDSVNVNTVARGAQIELDGKVKTISVDADSVNLVTAESLSANTLDIAGEGSSMTIGGKITNVDINQGSVDNEIEFTNDARIQQISLYADGDNDIETSSADIGSFIIGQSGSRMSLALSVNELTLDRGASGANITFTEGTKSGTLNVDANDSHILIKRGASFDKIKVTGIDVTIEVEEGGSVDTIECSGSGLEVTGEGNVGSIKLKSGGTRAVIDIPNTTVDNGSNGAAQVGDGKVEPGKTGATDENGKRKLTAEEEEELKKQEEEDKKKEEEGEKLPEKDSAFNIILASKAQPFDLHFSGNYDYSDFVTGMVYNETGYRLSGVVNAVYDFPLLQGTSSDTGYYVPVALSTTAVTKDFTLRVMDKTYTQNDVSKGSAYPGRMVFFLPLNPNSSPSTSGTRSITIFYDADGAKNGYSESQLRIDYTYVTFVGGGDSDFTTRSSLIAGAPGIGEEKAVSIGKVAFTSTSQVSVPVLHEDLGASDNTAGVEGYWAGVKFVGPKSAVSADYVIVSGGQTTSYRTNLGKESFEIKVDDKTDSKASSSDNEIEDITGPSPDIITEYFTVFNHYEDVKNVKQATISITWRGANNVPIGNIETYILDYSGVKLRGISNDPDDPNADAVATSFTIEKYNADQFMVDFHRPISDLVQAYNIVDLGNNAAYFAGTYFQVALSQYVMSYYLPVRIGIKGLKHEANLCYGNGRVIGRLSPNGDEQFYLTVLPITAIGSQAQDIELSLIDRSTESPLRSLKKTLYGSQAAIYQVDTGMMLVAAPNSFSSGNMYYSAMVDSSRNFGVYPAGEIYTVLGGFNKVSLEDGRIGWAVPIRVINYTTVKDSWRVRVTYDGRTILSDKIPATSDTFDIAVPVAYSDSSDVRFSDIVVEVMDSEGKEVKSSCKLDASSAVLNGISAGTSTGVPSSDYLSTLRAVDRTTFNLGGYKFNSIVDSGYEITHDKGKTFEITGSYKRISSGYNNWYAPATVKLEVSSTAPTNTEIPKSWEVEVAAEGYNDLSVRKYAGLASGECQVLIPLGGKIDGSDVAFKRITVKILDTSGQEAISISEFTVVPENVSLKDFVVSGAESPMPNVSVTLANTEFSDEGLTYGSLVTRTPSLVMGTITNQGSSSEVTPIAVSGIFAKATLADGEGWAIPLRLNLGNITSEFTKWTATVYHGDTMYKTYNDVAIKEDESNKLNVTVPLATVTGSEDGDRVYNNSTIRIFVKKEDGTSSLYSTVKVAPESCTFTGFTEKIVRSASIVAATSASSFSDSVCGYTYDKMVSAPVSLQERSITSEIIPGIDDYTYTTSIYNTTAGSINMMEVTDENAKGVWFVPVRVNLLDNIKRTGCTLTVSLNDKYYPYKQEYTVKAGVSSVDISVPVGVRDINNFDLTPRNSVVITANDSSSTDVCKCEIVIDSFSRLRGFVSHEAASDVENW